jgi:methyl-accepting chemotaxis protein
MLVVVQFCNADALAKDYSHQMSPGGWVVAKPQNVTRINSKELVTLADIRLLQTRQGWEIANEKTQFKNAFMTFALLMLNYDSAAGLERVLGSLAILVGIEIVLALVIGRHFARRAERLVNALNHMAKGDLSKKLKLSGRDDFAWLAYEYDSARKSLVKLVTDLSQHSASVSDISSQLADDSQEISDSTRK